MLPRPRSRRGRWMGPPSTARRMLPPLRRTSQAGPCSRNRVQRSSARSTVKDGRGSQMNPDHSTSTDVSVSGVAEMSAARSLGSSIRDSSVRHDACLIEDGEEVRRARYTAPQPNAKIRRRRRRRWRRGRRRFALQPMSIDSAARISSAGRSRIRVKPLPHPSPGASRT